MDKRKIKLDEQGHYITYGGSRFRPKSQGSYMKRLSPNVSVGEIVTVSNPGGYLLVKTEKFTPKFIWESTGY